MTSFGEKTNAAPTIYAGSVDGPSAATLLGTGPAQAPALPRAFDRATRETNETKTPDASRQSTRSRSTVLPRRAVDGASLSVAEHPRFERVKTLGEGAMGHVDLVRDNDIRRTVAVKRLRPGSESAELLSRFADEVRVIGQLEHPGIVPIYDVDRADDGQPFLVMKHVQGETMEHVIERLRAGDLDYALRFTLEYRVRLFLSVLDAMSYAHAHGVLHRDLKPANIIIGPYGEVTVLDWGIAKPIPKRAEKGAPDPRAPTVLDSLHQRLNETHAGQLAGTPLYMSPEQAAGLNDDLDERSDVHTLCTVFYEWLVLHHPLEDRHGVNEVLTTLVLSDYTKKQLVAPAQAAGVPMEYVWIASRGLTRDRAHRYQTVKELEAAIKAIHDGHIRVQCDVTFAKSLLHSANRWIDRHSRLYTALFRAAVVSLTAAVILGGALAAVWLSGAS
jgi:serine/threonine protein kinase